MKISLFVGVTEYILAHGSTNAVDLHVGPSPDIRHNERSVAQVDQIIGAAEVKIEGRGNLQGALNFSVEVRKANLNAATIYALTYPSSLPRAGTLKVFEGATLLATALVHIDDVGVAQHGLSITLTYSITVGKVA